METKREKRKTGGRSGGYTVLPRSVTVIFCYIMPALLVAALTVVGVWGNNRRIEAEALRRTNEGIYRQAYTELAESVYNMNIALSKLLVSEAPSTLTETLDEIWRESGTIAGLMGRIPQSHVDSVELNRFLIQAGDYARRLSTGLMNGVGLSEADRGQLMEIYTASEGIFSELSERLNSNSIPLAALNGERFFSSYRDGAQSGINAQNTANGANAQSGGVGENGLSAAGGDEAQDEASSRYPTLIYDGPFSESTEKRAPVSLNGEAVDGAEAVERARAYLDDAGARLEYVGVSQGRLPFHGISAEHSDGRRTDMAVTVNGGRLLYLREDSAGVQNGEAAPSSAESGANGGGDGEGIPNGEELAALKQAGLEWLKRFDYPEMEATYAQYYENSVLITFAAVQTGRFYMDTKGFLSELLSDGADMSAVLNDVRGSSAQGRRKELRVILYNDLVKLWIERKTARVICADMENYLFSHEERALAERILSAEAAAERLSPNLAVEKTALALIPRPDQSERLCWEFTGSFAGVDYIVYMDAVTGDEVQIFRLITDENGSSAL